MAAVPTHLCLPVCKYDGICYQKNQNHFSTFQHPKQFPLTNSRFLEKDAVGAAVPAHGTSVLASPPLSATAIRTPHASPFVLQDASSVVGAKRPRVEGGEHPSFSEGHGGDSSLQPFISNNGALAVPQTDSSISTSVSTPAPTTTAAAPLPSSLAPQVRDLLSLSGLAACSVMDSDHAIVDTLLPLVKRTIECARGTSPLTLARQAGSAAAKPTSSVCVRGFIHYCLLQVATAAESIGGSNGGGDKVIRQRMVGEDDTHLQPQSPQQQRRSLRSMRAAVVDLYHVLSLPFSILAELLVLAELCIQVTPEDPFGSAVPGWSLAGNAALVLAGTYLQDHRGISSTDLRQRQQHHGSGSIHFFSDPPEFKTFMFSRGLPHDSSCVPAVRTSNAATSHYDPVVFTAQTLKEAQNAQPTDSSAAVLSLLPPGLPFEDSESGKKHQQQQAQPLCAMRLGIWCDDPDAVLASNVQWAIQEALWLPPQEQPPQHQCPNGGVMVNKATEDASVSSFSVVEVVCPRSSITGDTTSALLDMLQSPFLEHRPVGPSLLKAIFRFVGAQRARLAELLQTAIACKQLLQNLLTRTDALISASKNLSSAVFTNGSSSVQMDAWMNAAYQRLGAPATAADVASAARRRQRSALATLATASHRQQQEKVSAAAQKTHHHHQHMLTASSSTDPTSNPSILLDWMGIVVPYDKRSEVGYRPPYYDSRPALAKALHNLFFVSSSEGDHTSQARTAGPGVVSPTKRNHATTRKKDPLREDFDDQMRAVDIGNDECDFGLGLEIGRVLWHYGAASPARALSLRESLLSTRSTNGLDDSSTSGGPQREYIWHVLRVLGMAYELLNRPSLLFKLRFLLHALLIPSQCTTANTRNSLLTGAPVYVQCPPEAWVL